MNIVNYQSVIFLFLFLKSIFSFYFNFILFFFFYFLFPYYLRANKNSEIFCQLAFSQNRKLRLRSHWNFKTAMDLTKNKYNSKSDHLLVENKRKKRVWGANGNILQWKRNADHARVTPKIMRFDISQGNQRSHNEIILLTSYSIVNTYSCSQLCEHNRTYRVVGIIIIERVKKKRQK